MRRTFFVLLLALVVMTVYAQQSSSLDISVSSGVVLPSSPMTFANYWKMQYGGAVRVGYTLSASVQLVGALEHYQFKLDREGIARGFNTQYMSDIWVFKSVTLNPSADVSSVSTGSANLRFAPSGLTGLLSPYFIGGVGLMRFSLSEIKLPTTSVLPIGGSDISITAQQTITGGVETSAFFQLGMGLDVRLSQSFDMFVEARYVSGLNSGLRSTYVPITGGVKVRL